MKKGLTIAGLILAAQMNYAQLWNVTEGRFSGELMETVDNPENSTTIESRIDDLRIGETTPQDAAVPGSVDKIHTSPQMYEAWIGDRVKDITDYLWSNPHIFYFLLSAVLILIFNKKINDKVQKPLINLWHTLGATAWDLVSALLVAWSAYVFLKEPLGISNEQTETFIAIFSILTVTPWINNYFNGNIAKWALKVILSGGSAYLIGDKNSEIFAVIDKLVDAEHVGWYVTVVTLLTVLGFNDDNRKEFTKLLCSILIWGYAFGSYINVDMWKPDWMSWLLIEMAHKPGWLDIVHDVWSRVWIKDNRLKWVEEKQPDSDILDREFELETD